MRTTVVLKDVKAGDLPQAWRRRVKAKTDERLTVTITRPKPSAAKKPNATFGMWADRTDLTDPAAYVRALRAPRTGLRR